MAAPASFSIFAIALFLGAASATPQHGPSTEFSYTGPTGPENWGKLSPSFASCSNGKQQSPVHILKNETTFSKDLQPLNLDYKESVNATLVNTGHSIEVPFEGDAGVLVLDGKNYSLKQMHWHSPSEHIINGVQYAAELHLVHKTSEGDVAVVGVLYEVGEKENPLLRKIGSQLVELAKEVCGEEEEAHVPLGKFKTCDLQKKTRKFYRYMGSLTTPPCTENVTWTVLAKVRSITQAQVDALKAPLGEAYKNNARPTQPLNGRKIELFDGSRKR